jgi:hypothetical protein
MAKKAESPARRKKLLGDIRKAIDAIRHFSGRVEDASTRTKFSKSADRLEANLPKIRPATHK